MQTHRGKMLNVRDGGFDLWAGVIGGALMAVWEIFRRRPLWKPVLIACGTGVIAYTAMTGFL